MKKLSQTTATSTAFVLFVKEHNQATALRHSPFYEVLQKAILRLRWPITNARRLCYSVSRQNTMTLSFLQAFRANQSGAISWDEYIHNLLARCGGIKHEEDNRSDDYLELRKTDPLGHSIWTWSNEIETVKGWYSA